MKSPCLSHKSSLVLLGFLTLLFHYPITQSPIGSDNFFYITIIETIVSEGQIFWSINLMSLYGLFPGTSPLGVLILGSVIMEITGLTVHNYHLIHSILFSLVGVSGFFILSGELTNSYRSRWFASLCFSLAPRFSLISQWHLSLRYALIAMLPFFIWIMLRLAHQKYGRHPARLIILSFIFILVLPSLHRMAFLIPGMILAFILSFLLIFWQENATNRERAGRQGLGFLLFLAVYLFYLQYLDFTPYSPSSDLFEIYLFSGSGIFSSILNLVLYYLIAVGPIVFLSLLGVIFWFQEGRVSIGYYFGLTYLTLSVFIISDHIYISYLVTFGIILFIGPGIDFFIDNLQDYPKRIFSVITILTLLVTSFSYADLNYQIEAHAKEELNYSLDVRDSSLSVSYWMEENVESSVFECNDSPRLRHIAAYNSMINVHDSLHLSTGLINISEMELERITVREMYWNASDYLWTWENKENFSLLTAKEISLSVVNLAMPNSSGQSSIMSITLDYYYKNMPSFTYKLYSNSELALYWSLDY